MNKGYFHSSGTLPIIMYPDRFHVQDFVFTVDSQEWDITGFTWQLLIKKNKGNNINLISLTLGNGLSFPAYETNRIRARFEAAQLSALGEGTYFWMLIKTDTNEPILKGDCFLDFDPQDGGDGTDVTVDIINNTITVQIESLLTGNSSGGSATIPTSVLKSNNNNVFEGDTVFDGVNLYALSITASSTFTLRGNANFTSTELRMYEGTNASARYIGFSTPLLSPSPLAGGQHKYIWPSSFATGVLKLDNTTGVLTWDNTTYQPLDSGLTDLSALDTVGNNGKKIEISGGTFVASTQITNPATTNGDLIYYTGSAFQRLGIGSSGNVLTVSGGVLAWGSGGGGGSGTVTTVSVVSANGLAGTVANATTTPAITISTTITGILKGDGTSISAAVSGTDYQAPGLSWLLASGGTLSGANTITGTAANTLKFNFSGLNAYTNPTDGAGLHFQNTTAAAVGAQQYSPPLILEGQGWKTNATAASQSVKFAQYVIPVQGAVNPAATLFWRTSYNGGAYSTAMNLAVNELNTSATLTVNGTVAGTAISAGTGTFSGGITSATTIGATNGITTGSFTTGYIPKVVGYTLAATDHTVEVTTGTNTQTLPTAVGITGKIYFVTNSGSGVVTLGTSGAQTFVNQATTPTSLTIAQFGGVMVQSNGANWIVMSKF